MRVETMENWRVHRLNDEFGKINWRSFDGQCGGKKCLQGVDKIKCLQIGKWFPIDFDSSSTIGVYVFSFSRAVFESGKK